MGRGIISLAVIIAATSPAFAESGPQSAPLFPPTVAVSEWPRYAATRSEGLSFTGFTVDLQGWLVTGDLNWRIRIPADPEPPLSELIFPTESTLPVLTLNWGSPSFGFTARFATGNINQGASTDSDWLTTSPTPSLQSQQPSSGGMQQWSADLTHAFKTDERATHMVYAGWQSWTYNIHMGDPVTYTICDPLIFVCPPVGVPLTLGLNSTYDITYSGPRVGFRETVYASDQVTLTGSFSFAWVSALGTGFWNLRDLTFTHEGSGSALMIELTIGWTPSSNWMIRLGYAYAAISVVGRETLFCDPSFCGDPDLDWDARTTNQGVTLIATYLW